MPGEISGHGSVNHLIPLSLLVIINLLSISNGSKHLMSIIINETETCTGSMRYWEDDVQRLRKSGVSEIDEEEVLLSLEEKPANPKSNWCTPPFYFYTREDAAKIREAISDGCGTDAPGSLVAWMCQHSVLHSMKMPGSRYDIGNLESYENVQKTYKGITK